MSTPNTPAPATNAALVERLNQLTQSIAKHESAIIRSTRTTATIGLIALIFLSGYFYYGYVMIRGLLQPDQLVPLGTGMLVRNLPSAREALVKQISDSAPTWAASVSESAQKGIPELRGKLENYVLKETDTLLVQATSLTEEKFRKALQDNREVVEKGFKELAADDKLSEASLQELVGVLEQELKADMRDQAKTVLETLRGLSKRVQRLSIGKGLDEEERSERRIAMLARRLQLMEADPKPIKMPELKKVAPAADAAKSDKPKADSDTKDANDASKKDPKDDNSKSKTGDEAK